MISEISPVEPFFWSCIWQSTVFIVAGLLGSFILRHRSARAHQVLFLSIIAAITLPVISILVKHYGLGLFIAKPALTQSQMENQPKYKTAGITSVENIEHNLGTVEKDLTSVITAPKKTLIPLHSVVLYCWLVASLVLMLRLVVTFILGIRLLERAMPLDCETIEKALHLAKAKLKFNKDVFVYSSKEISSPIIWCWKREPILLLLNSSELSDNRIDWASIFCHELAHYKRRDYISGLFSEIIICLIPWHPLLWWAKYKLTELSEQACDDWVLSTGQTGTDYAESLLDLIPGSQMAFIPSVLGNKKGLAGRIQRILKNSYNDPKVGKSWAFLVIIIAMSLVIGVAFAQTRPARQYCEENVKDHLEQDMHHISSRANINMRNEKGQMSLHPYGMEGHAAVTTDKMNRLIAALSNDQWSREREHAAITISRIGVSAQAAIPILTKRLEDKEWYVRRAAAIALTSMGSAANPAVPALIKTLSDEEWLVRRASAEAAAAIGPASRPAVPALIKLLDDEEWQARQAAAEALAAIGPASASAVPTLTVALDDMEWFVRWKVAEALAAIGPASKPATPRLIEALNDEEWQVRKAATLALGSIGQDAATAIPTLIKMLEDPEWQVRHAIADALEKISKGDKSATPKIIEALLDPKWTKRRNAAQSLKESLQKDMH